MNKPRPILCEDGYSVPRKDVARLIRWDLARAFPNAKFSVRCETYSMGGCINIGWTNGPTTKKVESVVGKYGSNGFDGMDDSTYSYWHWICPSGRIEVGGTSGARDKVDLPPPVPSARKIRLGSGSVSCARRISDGHKNAVRQAWRALNDLERVRLWRKLDLSHMAPTGVNYAIDAELSGIPDCWRDDVFAAMARAL